MDEHALTQPVSPDAFTGFEDTEPPLRAGGTDDLALFLAALLFRKPGQGSGIRQHADVAHRAARAAARKGEAEALRRGVECDVADVNKGPSCRLDWPDQKRRSVGAVGQMLRRQRARTPIAGGGNELLAARLRAAPARIPNGRPCEG